MTDRTDRRPTAAAARLGRALTLGAALLAAWPAPAGAGLFDAWAARRDDCAPCTRHAYAEYGGDLERSRSLDRKSCACLARYAEAERARYNGQALPLYAAPGGTPTPSRGSNASSLLAPVTAPIPRVEPMLPRIPRAESPTPPPPPAPAPAGER